MAAINWLKLKDDVLIDVTHIEYIDLRPEFKSPFPEDKGRYDVKANIFFQALSGRTYNVYFDSDLEAQKTFNAIWDML